jgi:hypothetical protein
MANTPVRQLRAYVCLAQAVIRFAQERAPEAQIAMTNFENASLQRESLDTLLAGNVPP